MGKGRCGIGALWERGVTRASPNPTVRTELPKRAAQFGGNPLRNSPYAVPGGNAAAH